MFCIDIKWGEINTIGKGGGVGKTWYFLVNPVREATGKNGVGDKGEESIGIFENWGERLIACSYE